MTVTAGLGPAASSQLGLTPQFCPVTPPSQIWGNVRLAESSAFGILADSSFQWEPRDSPGKWLFSPRGRGVGRGARGESGGGVTDIAKRITTGGVWDLVKPGLAEWNRPSFGGLSMVTPGSPHRRGSPGPPWEPRPLPQAPPRGPGRPGWPYPRGSGRESRPGRPCGPRYLGEPEIPVNSLQLPLCKAELISSGAGGKRSLLCLCFIQMVWMMTHVISSFFLFKPGHRLGVVFD